MNKKEESRANGIVNKIIGEQSIAIVLEGLKSGAIKDIEGDSLLCFPMEGGDIFLGILSEERETCYTAIVTRLEMRRIIATIDWGLKDVQ